MVETLVVINILLALIAIYLFYKHREDNLKKLELIREIREEKEMVENKVAFRTEQINKEKARFQAAINNLPSGLIMIDNLTKEVLLNPLIMNILRLPKNEMILSELKPYLQNMVDFTKIYEECLKTKKIQVLKDINIGSRIYEFYFAPVDVGGEGESGCLVIVEDITETKLLERKKDEFVAVASHELRTPLTSIRGNAEIILNNFKSQLRNKDLKESIQDIYDSSITLIKMVNDFLDTSRLENNKIELVNDKFDLSVLAKKVVISLEQLAISKGLYLKFIDNNEAFSVFNDKQKARQIIINIIGNAIKYTHAGGITVEVKKENEFAKIFVKDTGIGIKPIYQNLLFQKFQRAGNDIYTRDIQNSTGMGLYISKLLAKLMGGEVKLESSVEGEGSVFSFKLPLEK